MVTGPTPEKHAVIVGITRVDVQGLCVEGTAFNQDESSFESIWLKMSLVLMLSVAHVYGSVSIAVILCQIA